MCRTALIVFPVLIALLVFAGACHSQTASTRDRFLTSNPNDGWEYGFLDEEGSFILYNTTFDDKQGIAGWALNNTPGPEGDITINYTDQPIDRYGVHWEPEQICMHSPLYGQGVAVRWTSPDDCTLSVETRSIADARVEIRANGEVLARPKLRGSLGHVGETKGLSETFGSSTVTVGKGSRIELVVQPDVELGPYHVGVSVMINSVGPNGIASARTTLGAYRPRPQIQLLALDKMLGGVSHSMLVDADDGWSIWHTLLRRG